MFTWKPIYRELIDALLPYRNRQGELIRILTAIEANKAAETTFGATYHGTGGLLYD